MSTFFMYENHPYPPSLYDRRKLRLGKRPIYSVFCQQKVKRKLLASVVFDVKIQDGTAIVHLLPTNGGRIMLVMSLFPT